MNSDYTAVWKELNSGFHVLLLVEYQGDNEYFDLKVDDIKTWFSPIVKANYGRLDMLMHNEAFLSVRKLIDLPSYPIDPSREGTKVMWLRYG